MTINFYFEKKATLKQRLRLKRFIESIFRKEGRSAEALSYIFCDDEYLLRINQQFLKHNFYTDIISFDLSESKAAPISGEIYISIDRVRENARVLKNPISEELHRVIFHGVLHLCGYKDKTVAEQKKMRELESQYLKKYGIVS